MNIKIRRSLFLMMGLGLSSALIAPQVVAQDEEESVIEEVITIGTRSSKPRSVTDSPAPVDVFKAEEFLNQGDTDVNNLLRNSVPSYNVGDQPISDAATLVRPPNLRGLSPDHTLILMNGKRRHRASVITWLGNGISNGSQGPDSSAIPALALKSVEVLRDGAAAQYGSDAIAGVINFQLNDATEGGTFEAKYGEYSEGDGGTYKIGGNVGFALGENGFGNVTVEYGESNATSRSIQRDDAAGLITAGVQNVPDPAQVWGKPAIDNDLKVWGNFGFELDTENETELYSTINYNTKDVAGGFFYRNPTNRPGVYGTSVDTGVLDTSTPDPTDTIIADTLLLGDLTSDGTGGCPATFDATTGATLLPNTVAGLQDAAFISGVLDNPNCFHFTEVLSGGFTPSFGGTVEDESFLVGLRGETKRGIGWDFSVYNGNNVADFAINNTVNASFGPNTPLNFDPGAYEQNEFNVNLDIAYPVSDILNLGFGAEYRKEEFTIHSGQSESYTAGPLATQGFSTSSNGFPGFPLATSGTWDRGNKAFYVDSEWDASDRLLLQAAIRHENFDDFGTTTNYKLGGNFQYSDNLGFRATYSTGFKAPTPGQSNASNTSTEFQGGVLINNGTIPSTNPIAARFGGRPLGPEESKNFSIGTFFNWRDIDVTIDYFNIDVEDRLNLSREITLSAADIASLVADGIPGAGDLTNFRYFTNDFDTNTQGIDIIVGTSTDWLGGTTDWNFAYNHTNNKVENFNPLTIDTPRLRQIESTTPENRWNLSGNHSYGKWRFLARLSYYDEWYDSFEFDNFGKVGTFDAETLMDIEVAYDLNEQNSVLFGINNVFDNSGQSVDEFHGFSASAAGVGNEYSQYSPFGFNGAFWYLNYRYKY